MKNRFLEIVKPLITTFLYISVVSSLVFSLAHWLLDSPMQIYACEVIYFHIMAFFTALPELIFVFIKPSSRRIVHIIAIAFHFLLTYAAFFISLSFFWPMADIWGSSIVFIIIYIIVWVIEIISQKKEIKKMNKEIASYHKKSATHDKSD